jgi:protein-S-isoprenylcysteine O-methyltransferase Ste14
VGFVGDLWVPKSVDSGAAGPALTAGVVDLLLITLFGVQHSVMARQGFKCWWTRYVPSSIERSTFVLATVAVLAIMFISWRPIPIVLWEADGFLAGLLWAGFAAGWLIVLVSTFQIDHLDLFGLRQVFIALRSGEYAPPPFKTPCLYRFVRHPMYLGLIVAFWSTPGMTVGHLLFAAGFTIYIVIGARIEERDLVRFHGSDYVSYRRRVPMLLPRPGKSVPDSGRPMPGT